MRYDKTLKEFIWTTKDGRDIPLSKMDLKHLENTIIFVMKKKMCLTLGYHDERAVRTVDLWHEILNMEYKRRLIAEGNSFEILGDLAFEIMHEDWGDRS